MCIRDRLTDKILNTIRHQFFNQKLNLIEQYNQENLLNDLPISLYGDVCKHVFKELISKIDFFFDKPNGFITAILPHLKPIALSVGDELYRMSDHASEIYFITKGRVISQCLDREGKLRSQIYVEGSYFGEVDIIFKRARTSNAIAETEVELWKINKEEFLRIVEKYPEIYMEVVNLAYKKENFRGTITKHVGEVLMKKPELRRDDDDVPQPKKKEPRKATPVIDKVRAEKPKEEEVMEDAYKKILEQINAISGKKKYTLADLQYLESLAKEPKPDVRAIDAVLDQYEADLEDIKLRALRVSYNLDQFNEELDNLMAIYDED
eukprot:TRINITY_DN6509_c0_g3_i1.p1 TRINITY_DN6509_c0_g3~~TRINITY_DN6509_c0_g3_i1.p1  ORF type:complete len:344 (-),score=107.75 TRINITY_DN6509_c0_g3_i1:104-1069(-)